MSTTMIQIRNVPDALHRRAKAKAALEGLSLSDFALRALEREVARLTPADVLARVRALPPVESGSPSDVLVREQRDAR